MTDYPARALISRSALENNLNVLRSLTAADAMIVVKADAYGHGLEWIARWAHAAGINWFGVAQLTEALQLRQHLPHARILTWIFTPGADLAGALRADVDLSIGSRWALEEIEAAARATGITARVHIKVDTGMARGGLSLAEFADVADTIARLAAEGVVDVVGLWSHLACADDPDSGQTMRQIDAFEQARGIAQQSGLTPSLFHLAASAGTLWHPAAHYDMVRLGIATYGVSPNPQVQPAHEIGLQAVMRVEASLLTARDFDAATGVSYGHTYVTPDRARLAVVPLGYADGIPRHASNRASVQVGAARCPIRGRICMDQFIIEGEDLAAGQKAVLFGDYADGVPTADDWAAAAGTIGYEIVTRIGARVPRVGG
ncbi:alanine racemase [Trueperella bialowiezensis]|uniref:Alanine racemase n=1 Tax=Trueperella bialowiezensis TaxID=312285 RepID=A0A3S4UY81_9ACTO|nr:alanine racemase [Trueperella bialowiezensis]VEI12806.1 Alanine racemase [Trueperella bialowiezensis]